MPSSLPSLWAVLTMPVVTVFCRAKGLPIATTNSPGLRSAERPRDSTGSFFCSHMDTHRNVRQRHIGQVGQKKNTKDGEQGRCSGEGETERERKKSSVLTKLLNYLRYGCENTHMSAVSLSHRAAVYESIPACLMNVSQESVRTWYIHKSGYEVMNNM